jgi:hypothetical protein
MHSQPAFDNRYGIAKAAGTVGKTESRRTRLTGIGA